MVDCDLYQPAVSSNILPSSILEIFEKDPQHVEQWQQPTSQNQPEGYEDKLFAFYLVLCFWNLIFSRLAILNEILTWYGKWIY